MGARTKSLFPLGIAVGAAHCNRVAERRQLRDNVEGNTHTWLWARRRMGKTSLIEQVLGELKRRRPSLPSRALDLNLVHDVTSLESAVRDAAAELAVELVPKKSRPQRLLENLFRDFRPEFTIGPPGLRMRLTASAVSADGIADVLRALDAAAQSTGRRAVLVMDEFQQLTTLHHGREDFTLEGAIRHAVERSTHIAYIFSGSQRSLLATMFENPDRPLYRLCQKMVLERISSADYAEHLQGAARARWGGQIDEDLVEQILSLSSRHPYYVNSLCSELWRAGNPPTSDSVREAWVLLVERDRAIVAQQVRALSAAQRALLVGLAKAGQVKHPTSRAFLETLRLSASTAAAAKQVLEDEDLIRLNEASDWELVDPVMSAYLREHR